MLRTTFQRGRLEKGCTPPNAVVSQGELVFQRLARVGDVARNLKQFLDFRHTHFLVEVAGCRRTVQQLQAERARILIIRTWAADSAVFIGPIQTRRVANLFGKGIV